MDLFDFIPIVPPGPEPKRSDRREENIAGGVVVFGLPTIDLFLLTLTELSKQPRLALLWLPVIFTLFGALICVLVRMSLGRTIVALLGCAFWCLAAGLTLVVIDILIFPF